MKITVLTIIAPLSGASRGLPGSLAVAPLIADKRYYDEVTATLP